MSTFLRGIASVALSTAIAAGLAACGPSPAPTASSGDGAALQATSVGAGTTVPAPATVTGPVGAGPDWSSKAIAAALTVLRTCAQAVTLDPPSCPQRLTPLFNGVGPVVAARWTLLNTPLERAVASLVSQDTGSTTATGTTSATPSNQVTVSGAVQMTVTYTVQGGSTRPYQDYVGGVATATETWDGTSFQHVTFAPIASPDSPNPAPTPSGNGPAPFVRPPAVTDPQLLTAVSAGFQDCVTIPLTNADASPPNCPMKFEGDAYMTNLRYVLDGDPMQGAIASFDPLAGTSPSPVPTKRR